MRRKSSDSDRPVFSSTPRPSAEETVKLYQQEATPVTKPKEDPGLPHVDIAHANAERRDSSLSIDDWKSHHTHESLLTDILKAQAWGTNGRISGYSEFGQKTTMRTVVGGHLVGLGVAAFTEDFDKFFGIDSAKIESILGSELPRIRAVTDESGGVVGVGSMSIGIELMPKPSFAARDTMKTRHSDRQTGRTNTEGEALEQWKAIFDKQKLDPACWCLPVDFILKFWDCVCDDLQQYAASHCCDAAAKFRHVCMTPSCTWHHVEKPLSLKKAINIRPLHADMHLVVQRYIKPWTVDFPNAGMALVYRAGHQSLHRQKQQNQETSEKPQVFISHCWNGDFEKFVKTLKNSFELQTQIWVCSFALWQHGDIQRQLGRVDECPFAIALASASRVLVVTDQSLETITRCWCVLEATMSLKLGVPYDVCLAEAFSVDSWNKVTTAVDCVDLKDCACTVQRDKDLILSYAEEGEGGIEEVNNVVRQVFKKASARARLSQAALQGDLTFLETATADDIRSLRDARGRGIIHMAAVRGQVSSMMYLVQKHGEDLLEMVDNCGMSPLCVAAHVGSTAGVHELLSMEADLEGSSVGGLTPLHFAASGGFTKVALMLLKHHANVEAEGTYRSTFGRRPLHIAARDGHEEVTRLLLDYSADKNAFVKSGATVLWHAVHAGHTECVVALVTARSDVNLQNNDSYKRVPLMAAVKKKSVALVSILLGAHADVNMEDGHHETSLAYCQKDSEEAEFILNFMKWTRRHKSRCGCCVS